MRCVIAVLLSLSLWSTVAHAQIGPPPGGSGSGMLANGTYAFTGKNFEPHCPLTASSGTFTPILTSCPASSSDGIVHFDVPLASGVNRIAFPSGGSEGQVYRIHLTGPSSGTPTLTMASGYVFPLAALSGGSVPVTGTNAFDIITCTLDPTAAVPNSSSFAQGGLVAECDAGNNYVQPTTSSPTYVASVPSTFSSPNNTGSGGAATLTLGSTLATATGDTLYIADVGSGNSGSTAPKPNFTGVTATGATLGTCVLVANTRILSGTGINTGTEHWECPIASGGTATLTGHWAATCYLCAFLAIDVHNASTSAPDAGIGATTNGSGTTASVSTTAGTAGRQYFYLLSVPWSNSVSAGPGGAWVNLIDSASTGIDIWYEVAASSASPVNATATFSSPGAWNAAISALTP